MTLEDVPRLDIATVRRLPTWPVLRERGGGQVKIEDAGEPMVVSIILAADTTSYGTRWWLRCGECGARRRHLYLLDGQLRCRGRACGRLLYFQQRLPDTRWRAAVARPALRRRDHD
jgi:hypothetical protein